MLRMLALALVIGLPGVAAAEQFPQSAQDAEVKADNGTVIGRVAAVERNGEGEIIAVEIPGLEPGDAPGTPSDLVAEQRRERTLRIDAPREAPARASQRVLR